MGGAAMRVLVCEIVGGKEKMGYGGGGVGVAGYEAVRAPCTKACIHCRGPEQTWLLPSSKATSAFPQKARGHRLGQRGET